MAEFTIEGHLRFLIKRWEDNKLTADEVVREMRTVLREEDEIARAEKQHKDFLETYGKCVK